MRDDDVKRKNSELFCHSVDTGTRQNKKYLADREVVISENISRYTLLRSLVLFSYCKSIHDGPF